MTSKEPSAADEIEIPYPVLIIQVLDCPNNVGFDEEDKDAHRHFIPYAPLEPICELTMEAV